MDFFGFKFGKKQQADTVDTTIRLPIEDNDGTTVINNGGGAVSFSMGIDPTWKSEVEQIKYYRDMGHTHSIDKAVDEIVSDAIVTDGGQPVKVDFENDSKISDKIKKRISEEFDGLLRIMNFKDDGHTLFREWYIDGSQALFKVVDPDNLKLGIQDVQKLDVINLKKIKEVRTEKDGDQDVVVGYSDYFLYTGSMDNNYNNSSTIRKEMRIKADAVAYVTSGLVDRGNNWVQSYLHKAIRPYNHLRLLEDAALIYKLVRAPQRRVFYVDVGNLPRARAEEYMRDIMNQYRNKITYDAQTGDVKDDRRAMAMLEDYWLARREGCFALDTKIKLLDGRDVELGQLIVEHKMGKVNWVYSVAPDGKIVPGMISWAGVTRNDAEVLDVYLDNGEIVTATPDHKFILRNGERVEAQTLVAGDSLMPLNHSTRMMNKTRSKGEYEIIQHNDVSEEFVYTHRMVSEFVNGETPHGEVIHHCDMDRFNNSPENLLVMGRTEHLELHTTMASRAWEVGNREEHIRNMSIGQTAFYQTERGIERRKEIGEFNLVCEAVWKGLAEGRSTIAKNRSVDKETMTHDEYLAKWSQGLQKMIESGKGAVASKTQRELDKTLLSKEDYDAKWTFTCPERDRDRATMSREDFESKWNIYTFSEDDSIKGSEKAAEILKQDMEVLSKEELYTKYGRRWTHQTESANQRYSDVELDVIISLVKREVVNCTTITDTSIVKMISELYPYVDTIMKLKFFLKQHGYNSITDLIIRNVEDVYVCDRRKRNAVQKHNHKVLKVVRRTDKMDVGTLTIDEHHLYHDYHNFALSSGIFVMNSKGTEISTLSGDVNQTIEDLEYFRRNLYDALNVPVGRLEPTASFSLGRASEITRDELRMSSNVNKLRNRYAGLFRDLLRTQLILKGIITPQEWDEYSRDIQFIFNTNVLFAEMKASEILQQRLGNLSNIEQYIGRYFSLRWVQKNVLYMTDEEIETQKAEIDKEIADGVYPDPTMTPEDMAPNDGAVAQGNWKGGDPKNPRV